ncbi:odorant receptor 131-2-like [Pleuronectes platessa]|uniref:odorant receptor 131-2-like n=1 Tax=Pleuronectes platessa TaxID=8262 RepID=UPI00232A13BD|nr:odorant receptor 131-2-like [Pleuronectes platessa]
MAANITTEYRINDERMLVQVFIVLFLCINLLLITTFFSKEVFYTTMRYVLFAVTLMSDCMFLCVTDILLILNYSQSMIQMWLCLILYTISSLCMILTPVTLTAMTLERYVAICLPLRHADLCSPRSTLHGILIIHSLSSLPCIVFLSVFFASASFSSYTQSGTCAVETFIIHTWQGPLTSAINQFYFLIMCITIVFSYVKIMRVAKAASGEDKQSTWRGLRTVGLHAFQLLLCLIQLWCPFVEAAVFEINLMLFIKVRFFNYITFILAPRCLSPLIYGLRDEMFFHALKRLALCGLRKKH